MLPSVGRIVHYTLSAADVTAIDAAGADYSRRNRVTEGDVYPAIVVRVFEPSTGTSANLQVFLDGDASYWATSRPEGEGGGTWMWPPRIAA